jgi:cell division septation protein DedD
LFTSAIKATRMVDAVIPTSEAGTVPVGAADAEVDEVDGAEVVPGAEDAGADALLVLEELHPAASRTAADSAITTPATRFRPGTRRPVPPRPGDSLLGLIAVPSTTSLPVRFGPAAALRPRPREIY